MNCNSYNCFNTVYCDEKINVKIIKFAVIVPKRVDVDILWPVTARPKHKRANAHRKECFEKKCFTLKSTRILWELRKSTGQIRKFCIFKDINENI